MKKIVSICIALSLTLSLAAKEVGIFPDIEGWTKKEEIKTYDKESLWEYINGAAEYYLNYGFENLKVAEYTQSEDIYIKAEIYYHSNPLNTFGIYAYERSEDGNFLNIGAEAYLAHSALNIYLSNYYIKIHSHNSSVETIETIKQLGEGIVKNINSKTSAPIELNNLPSENRIIHSEKYYPNNYMGYSFLKSVISSKYKIGENSFESFCIDHNSNTEAIQNLKQYFNFSKVNDLPVENKVYEFEDMFNGKLFFVISDSKIFGVWNATDANIARAYINELFENQN